VNDAMPLHMVELLEEALEEIASLENARNDTRGGEQGGRGAGELGGRRVLVMGYAYLEESDDTRNSPSEVLAAQLRERGAEVVVHDPFVPGYQGDLIAAAEGCDAAVVMAAHSAYRDIDLQALKSALRLPVLVDGRRVFDVEQANRVGFVYRGVGVAAL